MTQAYFKVDSYRNTSTTSNLCLDLCKVDLAHLKLNDLVDLLYQDIQNDHFAQFIIDFTLLTTTVRLRCPYKFRSSTNY